MKRLMDTYRRQPVKFVRGQGTRLFDDDGKEYLDFVAGVAVVSLGHAHPKVTEAITRQASELVHTSNLYATEPMIRLSEKLCEVLGWPDGKVFFANSGAEANECALKLVRKWSAPERFETIAAQGSFHGRTFETLAATGQPAKWKAFSPLPADFIHVAYNDPPAMEAAVTDKTAAVFLEPVLGEGGVVVPDDSYLPAVRKICGTHNLAFIDDEVQTGLGRCGNWFAFHESGAVPDVVTIAKALGNGLPIGACVANGEFAEVFVPGDHGSTMGGGPVVCAAALAVLSIIESDGLVQHSAETGDYLQRGLLALSERYDIMTEVRGKGLLIGVQLAREAAGDIVAAARTKGVLVNDVLPAALRLCPPLIVTRAECDRAVEILDEVLTEMA